MDATLSGRVCIVTGANSGIGRATALGLAKLGARVVMVCRDRNKGEAAQAEIEAQGGNSPVDLLIADLSSQRAIRQLAQDLKANYPQLHVLVNNAGLYLNRRTLTVDGLETTFAVNHLASFLLTNLLLETLKASAPARVVNVASSAHTSTLDFDNLQGEKRYNGMQAYSASKLCNILFTYELARRLQGTGITANCLHPGVVRTGLQRDLPAPFRIMRQLFATPERGAETSIYLASSPEVERVNGKYFADKKEATPSNVPADEAIAQRLWQVSAELTKLSAVTV